MSDYTFKELRQLKLKDLNGAVTDNQIQTLEELLNWAKGKTILVLDRKDVPVLERVRMVEECHAEACAIVMAYTYEEAKQVYQRNPDIMMQVFVSTPDKVQEFDQTGVPWENIIAFVSHQMPDNPAVFEMIHKKGALAVLGTSRNLDKELLAKPEDGETLKSAYQNLYKYADIIETDLPVLVGKLVASKIPQEKGLKIGK